MASIADLTESFGYLSPARSLPPGQPDITDQTLQDTQELLRQAEEHDRKYGYPRDARANLSDGFIALQSTPLAQSRAPSHANQNTDHSNQNTHHAAQHRRSWPDSPGTSMSRNTFEAFAPAARNAPGSYSPVSPVTFSLNPDRLASERFASERFGSGFASLQVSDASTPLARPRNSERPRAGTEAKQPANRNNVFQHDYSGSDHTFERQAPGSSPLTSPATHRAASPGFESKFHAELESGHEQTIESLKQELRRQKLANEHLSGRISRLEAQSRQPDAAAATAKPSADRREPVSEHLLRFKERLQIDKVDTLSGAEKSRLIKNLMLTLLVADFDHLPQTAKKVGTFLSWTADFLDKLHGLMYTNEMRPSLYLFDYETDIAGLDSCLSDMLDRLCSGANTRQ